MEISRNKTSFSKGAAQSGRTRLRKIWSCLECRRRRLHCDRVTPTCGRCKKSDKPEKCQYLHTEETTSPIHVVNMKRPTTKAIASPAASGDGLSVQAAHGQQAISFNGIAKGLHYAEAIFSPALNGSSAEVATAMASPKTKIHTIALASPESLVGPQDCAKKPERSKEAEENTSIGSMVDGLSGLHDFTKQAFREYPVMGQLRLNIHKLETESFGLHRTEHLPKRDGLAAHLPPRNEADALVKTYFSSLHMVYDILDQPEFQGRYESVWTSGSIEDSYSLVVVLLVMAMAMCLQSTSIVPKADHVKSYRDRATTVITACQLYIDQHPSRRFNIEELQAQFLLLWAQQLNGRRYKQTYVNAGKLIRTFMGAGLHRDTNNARGRELSINEKLLRKKIWMAALEFELQAAFEQGMPPASVPTQYILGMPEAFDCGNMNEGQHAGGLSRESSSLGLLYKSFPIRHRLCLVLNNSNNSMSSADAKAVIDALTGHLHAANSDLSGPGSIANIAAVLAIRQFLLALHRRQLQPATSAFERSAHRAAIVDHACSMIERSHRFYQNDDPALECLSGHQIHAALSLASVCLADDVGNDHVLKSFLHTQARGLLDKAIELIQLRVTRFTGDQRQLWTALAAQALVRIHYGDMGKEGALREAVAKHVVAFEGMGFLDRPLIQDEEPSTLMLSPQGVESWALDDWFDMDFIDFNAEFQ